MPDAVAIDYQRWGAPRHLTAAEFLALEALPSGLYVVTEGGLPLAMLVKNRGASATFVGFHAAMNPSVRRPLPFFQGRRIAPPALNMVLLSDPSLALHPELLVGWFLGNNRFDLPAILPDLLDHADRLMGGARRLLWGVSAGGFAAIRYARAQDTAVAVNPQTIIERFTRGRWLPWLRHGWGITDKASEKPFLAAHADLTCVIPRGRIVYVQNRRDAHMADHLAPWAAAHGLPTAAGDYRRFRLILGDWGEGHAPPPPAVQAAILREEAARLAGKRPRRWLARTVRAVLRRPA